MTSYLSYSKLVGVVVGVSAGILIISGLGFFLLRERKYRLRAEKLLRQGTATSRGEDRNQFRPPEMTTHLSHELDLNNAHHNELQSNRIFEATNKKRERPF